MLDLGNKVQVTENLITFCFEFISLSVFYVCNDGESVGAFCHYFIKLPATFGIHMEAFKYLNYPAFYSFNNGRG